MSSIKSLYTREAANTGITIKVVGPDGKETGDTIKVRGADSDVFQRAMRKGRREMLAFLESKGDKVRGTDAYQEFVDKQKLELQATLVMEWSFEEPCTAENVIALFTNAPDVAAQVDEAAGKRDRFASTLPKVSEPTQNINSV